MKVRNWRVVWCKVIEQHLGCRQHHHNAGCASGVLAENPAHHWIRVILGKQGHVDMVVCTSSQIWQCYSITPDSIDSGLYLVSLLFCFFLILVFAQPTSIDTGIPKHHYIHTPKCH